MGRNWKSRPWLHLILGPFGKALTSVRIRQCTQRSGGRMLAGRLKMGDASNADARL
jgi:hypothetical protein